MQKWQIKTLNRKSIPLVMLGMLTLLLQQAQQSPQERVKSFQFIQTKQTMKKSVFTESLAVSLILQPELHPLPSTISQFLSKSVQTMFLLTNSIFRGWLTTSTTAVRFLCSPLRFLFFSNNLYPSQSLQVLPSQVSETLLTTEQSQLT